MGPSTRPSPVGVRQLPLDRRHLVLPEVSARCMHIIATNINFAHIIMCVQMRSHWVRPACSPARPGRRPLEASLPHDALYSLGGQLVQSKR